MNVLLEQLKAAEAVEDVGMVVLIKRQLAYLRKEDTSTPVELQVHQDYYKVATAKPVQSEAPKPLPPTYSRKDEHIIPRSESVTDFIAQAVRRAAAKKLD